MPCIEFLMPDQSSFPSKIIYVRTGSDFVQIHENDPTLPLRFGCKKGNCGICAIKVEKGAENLTKISPHEVETLRHKNLDENCRLACQCAINGDVSITPIFPNSIP